MDKKLLDKIVEELSNMSDEEFQAELDKHMDGDIAKALLYAYDLEGKGNESNKAVKEKDSKAK